MMGARSALVRYYLKLDFNDLAMVFVLPIEFEESDQAPVSEAEVGVMAAMSLGSPHIEQALLRVAGFHVVYHFFKLRPTASWAELETQGRHHCATAWQHVDRGRGREMHVEQYCFRCVALFTPTQ